MSQPRSPDSKPPAQPDTDSRRALLRWIGSFPGATLAFLTVASGFGEQALVEFVERKARPNADSEEARLLSIATKGNVPTWGWLTDEEQEARHAERVRVGRMAAALDAPPPSSRSHAPISRPIPVGRRRPRWESTPRSARSPSSATFRSGAHRDEETLQPPHLTLLSGSGDSPPSTERSDPPTQPSRASLELPSQAAPPPSAVVVEPSNDTRSSAGLRRNVPPPPSSRQGEMAVADAIATLTQQGYSIRLDRKE